MGILKNIQVKTWTIIILVMYIIFLQECNKSNNIKEYENTSTIDTVFTRVVDSIYVLDTIFLTSSTISIDTVYINNDTLRRFENEVEDELLKGTIISYVDGTLVNQDFKYIAKFPQYIHTIDSVRITVKKPYTLLWVGGDIGGNENAFNISPTIGLTNKKGNSYYYRYNLMRKEHNIGLTRTLYKY
tara:strand:- start:32 stop:589 length:558 start_codon:yes stop_codon:yes gene_type:complete